MIPLQDNIPSRTTPFVNYAIIVLTGLVFLAQLAEDPDEASLIERWGMIPARISQPDEPVTVTVGVREVVTRRGVQLMEIRREAAPSAVSPWLTMFTCILLHGGWLHFLGNMWFLYIFGDNVEDRLGHVGYLAFYLGCGGAASLIHYVSGPLSPIPTIGASGAIAGVMGAYFVWYPRALVKTLVPIFYFLHIVVLPAPLFLGIWFALQLLQGALSAGAEGGGVAWWAHVGGFAAGWVIAGLLGPTKALRPLNPNRRPEADHVYTYRVRRRPLE